MLQCLEWEPSGTFYQMRTKESNSNGAFTDQSGLIDINLAADMTDPTLPPNPRKAILYHPSVTHLISVSNKATVFIVFLSKYLSLIANSVWKLEFLFYSFGQLYCCSSLGYTFIVWDLDIDSLCWIVKITNTSCLNQ